MMVGPPAWSNRAVARAQEEEHEERRRRKEREWEETESFAEERDSDVAFCGSDEDEDCHDDAYYEKLQKDQWSPFECASSFQAAKDRLIHAIGRCFVAYTLVVYKRPWLVIALSLMVSLLLAIGIPLRRVVKDGERQYALPWTRAHNDSLLYSNMFYGNLTRTEVIYVVANVEDTNLLTREFLDALWTFHLEVLELSVSVKPEEELMANTTLPPLLFDQLVGGLGVRDPNRRPHEDDFYWPRRLQTTEANSGDANAADFAASSFLSPIPLQIASQMSSLVLGPALHASASPAKTDLEVSSREKITEASSATVSSVRNVPLSTGREDDHADPVAPRGESEARFISNENKHAALGTLQRGTDNVHQSRQTPVLFRSERNLSVTGDNKVPGVPLQKPAALGATVRALGVTGGFGMSEFGCVETHAPAKDRISGLACRPPLPPGQYGFSNLCLKDKVGVCNPPEGVLFMYNDRREFGQPLGYPRHTSWTLATETITELWISQKGLRLNGNGFQVRGTSGFVLRYTLSDKPHMRPVARAWEAALVKLVENSRWRLPGASIYCKTDQSLEEGLSSSTGFKGSTDILFVLAAGTLIFGYVGLVTFSTNHFRSKMLVSVMGATAAALGYCGGAGLCYLVGLEHTTTATAAPFLVMGIGVDDVFVIINSYSLTFTRTVAKERLTITMRDSGLSITITTLTSIISFAIGATSPYLAIRNFCWITAAGILGGYLMCITFFLACLSIDAYYEERRQQTMARCCLLPVRRPPETGVQRARGGPLETEDAFSGSEGSRKRRPGNGWVGGLQSSGFRFSLPYTEDKKYLATARHSLLNQHASTVYECVTLQVAMEMTKGCELSARRQRPGSDDDSCGRLSDAPARPAREPKRTPKKRVAKAKAKQKAAVKEECDASHLQHPASGSERGASTAAENAPPSLEPATGAGRRGAAKAKAKAKQKGVLRAATPPDASKSIPNATPNLQKQEESKDAHDSSTESAAGRQRRVPPRGARKLVAELQPTKRGKKGGKSISDATANSERGSHTYAEEKTQGNLGHEATCVHPRTPKGAAAEAEMNTKQMSNASLSSSDSSSEDEPPSEVGEGLYRRGENARARAASRAADRGRRCTGFLNPRELSAVAFPRQGGIVRRTNGAKGARNLGQGKKGRTLQTRCPRQKLGAAGPRPRDARPSICRRGSANALPAFRDPRGRDAARNREADEETGTSVPGACGGAHEQPLGLKEQLKKLLDMAEQRQFNPHQTEEEKADAQIAEALGPVLQGKPAATVGPGAVVVLAIEEQLRQNRLETGVEQPRPKAKATLRRVRMNRRTKRIDHEGDEESAELKGESEERKPQARSKEEKPVDAFRLSLSPEDPGEGHDPCGASEENCTDRQRLTEEGEANRAETNQGLPPEAPEHVDGGDVRPRKRHRRVDLLKILTVEDLAEPPGNVGRRLRLIVLRTVGRMLLSPWIKVFLLIGFAAVFAKFFDAQEFFFNNYGDPVKIFFTSPRDICSRTFKSEYAWLHQKLESRGYTRHLVDGLHVFLSSPLGAYGPENNPVTCMRILRSWLQTPMGANFASQFAWQGDSELRAFQTLLIPVYFPTSEESSNFMVSLRRDLQSFKAADAHAYNRLFVFYESDTSILSSTLANMAWAGCAVLIVSVLLLPSLWSAIMVIVILVLIDVSIIGFMHFWDLPLNMLTMVNLIISIGFAIDYATHICHTFCHCVGRTRDLRVFETLVLIGNPIFHGVLSTLLGVSVLAFTRSYVLRVFFKMMTLVLVLAFAHGVILLPVLLSLVGPMDPRKEPVKRALKNFVRGLRSKGRTERSK
uniref:Sterol sensing 5-transmembrane protein, related n=1 Tax=Neospora caninum (strain Liverpool) TaxID=572307 RepID=A0A0F7U391_NEOCL|nr:TPA: Sterol sensing 5-transmembrane protein, related [Neospora caninum Liverpool]